MARIRSIKPEFWKDGKISRLTYGCMAFFIGLWNFCDDEGKCRADIDTIANSLPVFKKREIIWHVSALLREGLISISSDDHLDDISTLSYTHRGIIHGLSTHHHWIIVVSWHHQRISKPIHPKISINDLKDITPRVPQFGAEWYTRDRIGKDRIGKDKDRIYKETQEATEESNKPKIKRQKQSNVDEPPDGVRSPTVLIWDAYSKAYGDLYGKPPVRNAKVNSVISSLHKRLGDEAVEVVKFYLTHKKRYYVEKCHDIAACLQDAEALHTQWVRGRAVLSTEANQVEKSQAIKNTWDFVAEKLEREKNEKNI